MLFDGSERQKDFALALGDDVGDLVLEPAAMFGCQAFEEIVLSRGPGRNRERQNHESVERSNSQKRSVHPGKTSPPTPNMPVP